MSQQLLCESVKEIFYLINNDYLVYKIRDFFHLKWCDWSWEVCSSIIFLNSIIMRNTSIIHIIILDPVRLLNNLLVTGVVLDGKWLWGESKVCVLVIVLLFLFLLCSGTLSIWKYLNIIEYPVSPKESLAQRGARNSDFVVENEKVLEH